MQNIVPDQLCEEEVKGKNDEATRYSKEYDQKEDNHKRKLGGEWYEEIRRFVKRKVLLSAWLVTVVMMGQKFCRLVTQ